MIEQEVNAITRLNSNTGLSRFYLEQIIKFHSIGLGNLTENNVVVTERLIELALQRHIFFATKALPSDKSFLI